MIRAILFDLDGVLCDFSHSFSRLAATLYDDVAPHDTFTQDSFSWLFEKIGKEGQERVWAAVLAREDFWLKIPSLLTEYDRRAMWMLFDEGVDIIYLTNRHNKGTMLDQTQQWIWRHDLPNGLIHPVKDKDLHLRERMLEAGKPVLRLDNVEREAPGSLLGVIEDNPRNLEKYERGIAAWYTRPVVYAADRKYNRDAAPSLPRVNSVMDFCDRLLNYMETE